MKHKNRKIRLEARIKLYEMTTDSGNKGGRVEKNNKFASHKPGSYKK